MKYFLRNEGVWMILFGLIGVLTIVLLSKLGVL